MNQPINIQSSKLLRQRIRKCYYRTLGTGVIKIPLSPNSLPRSLSLSLSLCLSLSLLCPYLSLIHKFCLEAQCIEKKVRERKRDVGEEKRETKQRVKLGLKQKRVKKGWGEKDRVPLISLSYSFAYEVDFYYYYYQKYC